MSTWQSGGLRVEWEGAAVSAAVRAAAVDGLLDAAEHVLGVANLTVPHDEGTLERSGQTSVDEMRLEAAVSYDTPYAARLHEHPEYNFQGRGRGKWLQMALQDEAPRVTGFLGARIGGAM